MEPRHRGTADMNLRSLVLAIVLSVAATLPARAVEIQQVISPGGIEAWLVEDHSNPIISVNFAFRGGGSLDPDGKEGLAYMVSGLLDEGAGDLDSEAFQKTLADNAIRIRFDSSLDYFTGVLRTLTDTKTLAFDLLHLSLTEPRFDDEAVERIRAQIQTILRQQAENPGHIASETLWTQFFPEHPYGRPHSGTKETVAALTSDDLRSFVDQRIARDNLLIAVVGDITAGELAPILDSTFLDLPAEAAPSALPWQAPDAKGEVLVIERDIPQSVVRFGHEGIRSEDPDFFAAFVLNHILGGGGFSSRLTNEIRVKRGLVYGVGTGLDPRESSALMFGRAATANERVAETVSLVRQEWERMADSGPTEEELETTKRYLTGSYALRQSSTASIAGMLLGIQMDRRGLNYINDRNGFIEAVTIEDVKRVAKRLLDSEALTFVVVGQPDGVEATAEPIKNGT